MFTEQKVNYKTPSAIFKLRYELYSKSLCLHKYVWSKNENETLPELNKRAVNNLTLLNVKINVLCLLSRTFCQPKVY